MAQYRIDTQQYLPNGTTLFEANMLADKDGNIINSFGNASNIPIAAGQVTGHSHINKFGFNPAVGTGFEIVSDRSVAEQPYPTTAVTVSLISSATTADGGLNITIQGLDANYAVQEETVTLSFRWCFYNNQYIPSCVSCYCKLYESGQYYYTI